MNSLPLSALVSLGIMLLGAVSGYAAFRANVSVRLVKLEKIADCVPELERRMEKQEAAQAVFWKVLDPALAKVLHSPAHMRRDQLLARMRDQALTAREADELECLIT